MSKLPFTPRGQCHQDAMAYRIIVEGMGIQNPTALEIGTNHPIERNNTYELERLGWNCLLSDMDEYCCDLTREMRKSRIIQGDATQVDWAAETQFHFHTNLINFLSLDVDQATVATLKKLPLDKVFFSLALIEHDAYRFGPGPRDDIDRIMRANGYTCICPNIMDQGCEFESWWVNPALVKPEAYHKFRTTEPTDWKEIVNR